MLPYTAILNLSNVDDIKEFTKEYVKMYETTGKKDIPYMLSFMSYEDRILWNKAVGDIVHIDLYYNRPERELDRFFEYVNGKGELLAEFTNPEKGQHQDIMSVGTKIIKTSFETPSF